MGAFRICKSRFILAFQRQFRKVPGEFLPFNSQRSRVGVNELSPDQGGPIGSDSARAGLELQQRKVTVHLLAIRCKVPIALLGVGDASQAKSTAAP